LPGDVLLRARPAGDDLLYVGRLDRQLRLALGLVLAFEGCSGWCLTYFVNFSGHPAASIPAGLADDRLPVGMQLIPISW
jgi:Amidase